MNPLLALLAESVTQFAPHGYCFLWDPPLLWGMVTSDLLIAASYYSIPLALITFAAKRNDTSHNHLLWKFGLFIMLCGTTHLVYLWNIWHSDYYLELLVKLATGLVSFYVAINVWLLLPSALKLPAAGELAKLNKQLTASESRYRELFATANEGVVAIDRYGQLTMANQAMADMLGVPRDALFSADLFDFVIESDRETLGINIARGFNGEKRRYEIRCNGPNGQIIYTLISSSPIRDPDDKISGLLTVVTDLSEKIEILNQLEIRVQERTAELEETNAQLKQQMLERENTHQKEKEAKARLDAVFNASPNGIIITDKRGIITDVNVAAEAMFGYKRSELVAKHVNILTAPDFAAEHDQYIQNADTSLTTKKLGFGRKLTAMRRYNKNFPVDVALTKIAHSDEHYYMAMIRDLTEIDLVEDELRSVNERLQSYIDSLKQQTRETTLLNEYTELLQTSDDFDQYPAIVDAYGRSILSATDCRIYLVTHDNQLQSLDKQESFPIRDCWALKANHPYPLNQRQQKVPCKHTKNAQSTICLPLNATGTQLGLITFTMPDDIFSTDEKHLQTLEKTLQAFAIRTSICLTNLMLLKEKEMQSFKDELTGLYNRRFMNESLASYFPRATREKRPLTLLMIDVDHFKQFNDNYGHSIGDNVLAQVAHCIEQCMRESDLVCRFGGEEFLVVMYDATEQDGMVKANNIHSAVQTINNFPVPVTVSIGVAEKGPHDSADNLIQHADMALYEAKQNGRNQTQSYILGQPVAGEQKSTENRPSAE